MKTNGNLICLALSYGRHGASDGVTQVGGFGQMHRFFLVSHPGSQHHRSNFKVQLVCLPRQTWHLEARRPFL